MTNHATKEAGSYGIEQNYPEVLQNLREKPIVSRSPELQTQVQYLQLISYLLTAEPANIYYQEEFQDLLNKFDEAVVIKTIIALLGEVITDIEKTHPPRLLEKSNYFQTLFVHYLQNTPFTVLQKVEEVIFDISKTTGNGSYETTEKLVGFINKSPLFGLGLKATVFTGEGMGHWNIKLIFSKTFFQNISDFSANDVTSATQAHAAVEDTIIVSRLPYPEKITH